MTAENITSSKGTSRFTVALPQRLFNPSSPKERPTPPRQPARHCHSAAGPGHPRILLQSRQKLYVIQNKVLKIVTSCNHPTSEPVLGFYPSRRIWNCAFSNSTHAPSNSLSLVTLSSHKPPPQTPALSKLPSSSPTQNP